MSVYTLTVKKGAIAVALSTSDSDFAQEQLANWIESTLQYVRRRKGEMGRQIVNAKIQEEQTKSEKRIEEQIAEFSKKDAQIPPINDEPAEIPENIPVKRDVTFAEETFKPEINDLYEKESRPEPVQNPQPSGGFDEILEKSMHSESDFGVKSVPAIKKDNAFINYINSRRIEKKTDYLLMTAYYFSQYEQKSRFTLKQLNAKLMQNIAVIIDHSVLQEAINRDYIECLPDLTGLTGVTEYRLTSYGEKTLLDM